MSSRWSLLLRRNAHSNILYNYKWKHIAWNRRYSATQSNGQYFCLFYDYVDNILEKRKPVRTAHLELIQQYVNTGRCKLGGAFADNNIDGALIVFKCQDISEVQEFVQND
eukprot:187352_1